MERIDWSKFDSPAVHGRKPDEFSINKFDLGEKSWEEAPKPRKKIDLAKVELDIEIGIIVREIIDQRRKKRKTCHDITRLALA